MRSLARWSSLSLVAWPLGSWALGLGDIESNSFLNQPLDAEIPLSATPDELASLSVAMAPAGDFIAAGLDYPAFLSTIEFSIGRDAAGANVIHVSSRESITEPFLTMIVKVSYPRGEVNREYTVLLDPPLFLPEAAAVETITAPAPRAADPAGGAIVREPAAVTPPPVRAERQPSPQASPPAPAPAAAPEAPAASTAPAAVGGNYSVQAGDTLWAIASRNRASGVSMNQAMLAIFEANPGAFDGNINRLRRGAILRIPPAATQATMTAAAATAEVSRQIDEWRAGQATEARVVLLPPSDEALSDARAQGEADSAQVAELEGEVADLEGRPNQVEGGLDEAERLIEVQNEELAALREQLAAEPAAGADAGIDEVQDAGEVIEPEAGEPEQLFADEPPPADEPGGEEPVDETPAVEQPTTSTAVESTAPAGPSIVDRVIETVTNPIVLAGAGALVLLIGALAFLRRRRDDEDDVTGQWEALEAELKDDVEHSETTRLRAQAAESDMVVVEGHDGGATAEEPKLGETAELAALDSTSAGSLAGEFDGTGTTEIDGLGMSDQSLAGEPALSDQTLSSQTVINLDQADPIAEADFHMAYGLYDQAADLITKTLEADPGNRELKLKLLEVYFVWGNKEQFLASAGSLKEEIGAGADWDKIVIMGKQICPDEALFSEATSAAGEIDLDLESSAASPGLDFAFDENDDDDVDLDLGVIDESQLSLAATGTNKKFEAPAESADDEDMLDIGARTQAGLEAALFEDVDNDGEKTQPGADIDDAIAAHGDQDATMESPTMESRPAGSGVFDGLTLESPTTEAEGPDSPTVETPMLEAEDVADAPTVETLTVETVSAADAPTVETPTVQSPAAASGGDTVEQPRPTAAESTAEMTAELELDDLGLDVGDLENLSGDIAEEQPETSDDDDFLSATGVTQVLNPEDTGIEQVSTAVIGDDDATMMAPGLDAGSTGITTEVLEQPSTSFDPDPPATEDDLDLNLDDFSSALDGGAETIEQPGASGFGNVDLDIGADIPADDEPTGTEEVSPLDPQTMTEVGTKLDLARAYIDMGDPDGAKSILEEVLSEGDDGQRSEAQALIAALPA